MLVKKLRSFTLLEVLIALTIISISIAALIRGGTQSFISSARVASLTEAIIACDYLMKETISKGYPESGETEGSFEGDEFKGMKWRKEIRSLEIPGFEDLKLVTVEVEYGRGRKYQLKTVLSREAFY